MASFLENNFANSNGDLYKPDGVGSDLQWISNSITSYSDINLQTNEDTTDNGAFINFVEQMDNGSTEHALWHHHVHVFAILVL